MALPKKNKKDLSVKARNYDDGPKEYVDDFLDKNRSYLPRGVDLTDLDGGFIEFVKENLGVVIEGEKVPVNFLTLSRWREFNETWANSDKYKNIKIPFISVVRKPEVQQGTNPSDFKIPVRKKYTYSKVPTWDGNKKGFDIYKIPNPVGVDLTYTVRFFSFKMSELNILTQRIMTEFVSSQAYTNIKGHYFPILLENNGDESTVDNLEGKRFYTLTFEMKLMGYLVDEDEFEITPAIDRVFVSVEVDEKKPKTIVSFKKEEGPNNLETKCFIQFLPRSSNEVTFTNENKTTFHTQELNNINNFVIRVNGDIKSTPFTVFDEDKITVSIIRTDPTKESQLTLNGNIII